MYVRARSWAGGIFPMNALRKTLEGWVRELILDMRMRNYSAQTIEAYVQRLGRFFDWLDTQPVKNVPGITHEVLERYQAELMVLPVRVPGKKMPRTMGASTRNGYRNALCHFFRFLRRKRLILSNPAADLVGARVGQKLPRAVLTVPEINRLLSAIDCSTPLGIRNRAVAELFYSSGIRRGELLGLQCADLRLQENLVKVLGKGNKERLVPFGQAAKAALLAYLEVRRNWRASRLKTLFVGPEKAMRIREVREMLLAAAHQAGIKKPVSPHVLRHTCATHLLRGGADLRSIQLMLGHASLDVTATYTRVELSQLKDMIRRCHPRELPDAGPC